MAIQIQADSATQPTRVPLVCNLETRDGMLRYSQEEVIDAKLVNCFAQYHSETKSFSIEKRPGYTAAFFTPGAGGTGQGCYAFTPDPAVLNVQDAVLIISGGHAYVVHSIVRTTLTCTVIDLGAVNIGRMYRFVTIPANPPTGRLVVFGNGAAAYVTSGVAMTQLLPVSNFPTSFYKGWAYLNSRLYVFYPDRNILGALNLDDAQTWDPLNKIVAQDEPDYGKAFAKHVTFAVAFKEWTTEFFFNDESNLVGSTLSVAPQNGLDIGCSDADSVRDIDGTLLWVTSSEDRQRRVARMDQLKYNIISTPDVEKVLQTFGSSAKAFILKLAGHRYYVLTLGGLLGFCTLVYDLDQELWYVWENADPDPTFRSWGICDSTTTGLGFAQEALKVVQNTNTGALHLCDSAYITPTDNLQTFSVDIYTKNWDANLDRKKQVSMMYFDADKVAGSVMQMRVNDFDYDPAKWTQFRDINLDCEKPQLPNCGSFYRRAHHFKHALPCAFKIRAVGLQFDVGTL